MGYKSINPKNGEEVWTTDFISDEELSSYLEKAFQAYKAAITDGPKGFYQRLEKFEKLRNLLKENSMKIAQAITNEMGKPIKESVGEVDKCMGLINYYLKTAEGFMKEERLPAEKFKEVIVTHQPLGPTLLITPWNFPVWMSFKIGIPVLVEGNPILLKVASSTPLCGQIVNDLYHQAGFDNGEFQTVFIDHNQSNQLIQDKRLRGLKFVGSTFQGKNVAEQCAKSMKKACFELGGSDAFIVFEDADINLAALKAVQGRLHSNGQACNNSKRFLIHKNVYEKFKERLFHEIDSFVKIGDPLDESTTIGPLMNQRQKQSLVKQVQDSVQNGAKIIYGDINFELQSENLKPDCYFSPIVIDNIDKTQRAYFEELFGPVFSLYQFEEDEEAIEIANSIDYGLSASIFTQDLEKAKQQALKIEAGCIFINERVGSDPGIPNGGVKDSGYGRECFMDGLFEISNRKSIVFGK